MLCNIRNGIEERPAVDYDGLQIAVKGACPVYPSTGVQYITACGPYMCLAIFRRVEWGEGQSFGIHDVVMVW